MPLLDKRWQVAERIPPEFEAELSEYPAVLRQLLYNRGIRSKPAARIFLEARRPPGTEPENLLGLPAAVDRIRFAVAHDEPIAVYGDYDADGVTATALLTQCLRRLGASVEPYIPNRFDEGYGLNKEALSNLCERGVRLVVTVDCGVRSIPEAEYARQVGLDMIITDHHHPTQDLPPALAIINPKQPGDLYPEKELAGVGLAYKLASALLGADQCDPLTLDLVALGTVADMVKLSGENRALVRAGLRQMRTPQRQGLASLMGAAGMTAARAGATDISFILGPRLNAAGRLETALDALNLLLTEDIFEAGRLAQKLEVQNRERQQITQIIQEQAEVLALADNPDAMLLFAAHPEFNSGVVGLAASRLVERYYRPAIVACQGEEFTRGSCRSIPEFHITDALDQCADLMEHHGGHAAAAGFTIRNARLPELVSRLQSLASEQLGQADLRPVLKADMEIPLSDLRPDLLHQLDLLQPTGMENPPAQFVSRNLRVTSSRAVGRENAHLKMTVTDGRITFDAIAFRQGVRFADLPQVVDLIYHFETNEFNGRTSLQLNVRDIKAAGKE